MPHLSNFAQHVCEGERCNGAVRWGDASGLIEIAAFLRSAGEARPGAGGNLGRIARRRASDVGVMRRSLIEACRVGRNKPHCPHDRLARVPDVAFALIGFK
jgi:hypothetical protein